MANDPRFSTPDTATDTGTPPSSTEQVPVELAGLTWPELTAAARGLACGGGLGRKVHAQLHREGLFDPASLGVNSRTSQAWNAAFALTLPEVSRTIAEDGPLGPTRKAILRRQDGLETECVCLPMGRGRATLCISSQVGCKMGCGFCETGRMGLLKQLSAAEIIAQLLVAKHQLGWDFRNIVFMGMGEALDNAEAVIQAIRVMTDPAGMAISQERITVCTVGHVQGIERLADAGFRRLNLSVSLNAANDTLRDRLMPINRKHGLAALQSALVAYRPRPNFALGVNYCLLPDINDEQRHAQEVAAFCKPLGRCMVNLIPYNPGNAPITRAPDETEVVRFIGWLRDAGLPVRRRITKGRDVMAACGQLGNVALRERERNKRRLAVANTAPSKAPA